MAQILIEIEKLCRSCPDHIAYMNRNETLTYRELWERSDALADWLLQQSANKGPDTPILVYGHLEPLMPVCFLACMKAGRAYVPVDSSLPDKRVEQILLSSGADFMLSPAMIPSGCLTEDVCVADSTQDGRISIHEITSGSRHKSMSYQSAGLTAERSIYVIYTSGSTGNPKGVPISYNNLLSFTNWMKSDFPFLKEDVVLNQAPFSFDLSVMGVYPAWLAGAAVWAADRELIARPKLLFDAFRHSELSVWISTPSFADLCLMEPSFSHQMLPRLRLFLFCGEMLPAGTVRKLMERFPGTRIVNTYGPTEATVAVTSIVVDKELLADYSQLPVGYCKPDCKIRIWDEEEREVREGEKGEIVICGPSVGKGYLANPEMTAKSFRSIHDPELGYTNAYKTGDLGYLQNGLLFCCGRIDFQIKLHGYRIELEEIEFRLRELTGVKAGAVVPHWKDGVCDYLSAYLVPDGWPEGEADAIGRWRTQLGELLPAYMLPRTIRLRTSLPINGNGKLDRRRLQAEETS